MRSSGLLLIVVAVLSMGIGNGAAAAERPSREIEKLVVGTVKDLGAVIGGKLGGASGIEKSAEILDRLYVAYERRDVDTLRALSKGAEELRKSLVPDKDETQDRQFGKIESLKSSSKVKTLLSDMVAPLTRCRKMDVGGTLLSRGARLGGAVCLNSLGKRWIELQPGLSKANTFTADMASVSATLGTQRRWGCPSLVSASSQRMENEMFVAGIAGTFSDDIPTDETYGLGAGVSSGPQGLKQLNLKLLPLPSSDKVVLGTFLDPERAGNHIVSDLSEYLRAGEARKCEAVSERTNKDNPAATPQEDPSGSEEAARAEIASGQ